MSDHEPHLLVVDDDARFRELLRRYLSESGFRVTTAPGAAEARANQKGLRAGRGGERGAAANVEAVVPSGSAQRFDRVVSRSLPEQWRTPQANECRKESWDFHSWRGQSMKLTGVCMTGNLGAVLVVD